MTAMLAALTIDTWFAIAALGQLGAITLCALDDQCGNVLERSTATIDAVFIHPDPIIVPLLNALWAVMPAAAIIVVLAIGLDLLKALVDCIQSGRCQQALKRPNWDCATHPDPSAERQIFLWMSRTPWVALHVLTVQTFRPDTK